MTDWDQLLEGVFDGVVEEFPPVKEATLFDLSEELDSLDAKLGRLGQLMNPRTQEGRDLHSRRTAVVVEMKLRSR